MIGNLDLLYSCFNQYLFQTAKDNLSSIRYYYQTNPTTSGNALVGDLIQAIQDYDLENIGEPLFQGILTKHGKNQAEYNQIMGDIMKYKMLTKEQIEPSKRLIKNIHASIILKKAGEKYSEDPCEYINYVKGLNFKSSESDYKMTSSGFDKLDINSILASGELNTIPSRFDFINKSFPMGGYPSHGLIMFSAPPGCVTGDTEVFLADGTTKTVEELCNEGKKSLSVYSCDGISPKISVSNGGCIKTREADELIKVIIDDGGVVKCTPDHRFLMINGSYKEAKDLCEGDMLMPFNKQSITETKTVSSVEMIHLDRSVPVYDITNVEVYENYAIKTSENSGIFIHNCGKSLWAMQEALSIAISKRRVHYLALADLTELDFIVRLGAIYYGIPFAQAQQNIVEVYNGLKKIIGNYLEITCVPADTLTVDEYVEFMANSDFEVGVVDYDSNFKSGVSSGSGDGNLYLEYGNIYQKLSLLTVDQKKLLFVLAQPQKASWMLPPKSTIDLNMIGESSRKQHAADMIITGTRESSNNLGLSMFKIVKNRRGEPDVEQPMIRLNSGRFFPLPKGIYAQLCQIEEKRVFTEAELSVMVQQYDQTRNNLNGKIQQATQQQQAVKNPFS